MLTRNGVCYDLRETPFTYSLCGMTFHFTSAKHREKFTSEAHKRMVWMTDSMTRRFHFLVDASELALMQLYGQVETRGFLVEMRDGRLVDSLDGVSFHVLAG